MDYTQNIAEPKKGIMAIRRCGHTWQCCDGYCTTCKNSYSNYSTSDHTIINPQPMYYTSTITNFK